VPQRFGSVNWGAPVIGLAACDFSTPGVVFLVSESREVMNVRQASQYLGISPDTLYRYITEGEIPAFKLGNRWKLRKTILDRWMERKMSQVQRRR
jgi:excisionase family DNA binding protein